MRQSPKKGFVAKHLLIEYLLSLMAENKLAILVLLIRTVKLANHCYIYESYTIHSYTK